jgi:RNA recognition motif. (a.k.a. RRM, RBD, or RNP domain)
MKTSSLFRSARLPAVPQHVKAAPTVSSDHALQATEQDLWALFAPLGEVLELYVLRNNQTGRSRGCAFVTYSSRHLAQQVHSLVSEHLVTCIFVQLQCKARLACCC